MPRLFNPRVPPKQRKELSKKSWNILTEFDQFIASDPQAAARMTIKELRSPLQTIPRAERGIDWCERIIQSYCVKHMKAARCCGLMQHIRQTRLKDDEEHKFEALRSRINVASRNVQLTPHGFGTPLSDIDRPALAAELKVTFEILNNLGYSAFINSGTLLGAFREQTFIGHDDDIDLGVIIEQSNDQDIIDGIYKLQEELNASDHIAKPVLMSKGSPILKIELKSGVIVDLFPCWVRENLTYVWPHTYGDFSADELLPLQPLNMENIPFPAPKNPEKMIIQNYGPDWRTPDSTFRFHWGTANGRFKSLISMYKKQKRREHTLNKRNGK